MASKIFVDTEFTDFVAPKLISIGLAAQSGEEFYAELPFSLHDCSEFVRETVIPMLEKSPHVACTMDELYSKIVIWLTLVRNKDEDLIICYDYQTDWDLFMAALGNNVPSWCKPRLVADHINELLRWDYHEKSGFPEHHALYDALANRHAFREAISKNSIEDFRI